MDVSDEAGRRQYHFDPATYLAMMLAEVPAYRDLQHLAEATRDIGAGSILELGVGTGETAKAVLAAHPAAQLVGIDESEPTLSVARDRFPAADLRVQRLEDPLSEGNYDLVVSALTVHHLDGTGKRDLFRRVHDRLRPGGRFVLADVVIPDDPANAVTTISPPHDKPSTPADQLSWSNRPGSSPRCTGSSTTSPSSPPTASPDNNAQRPGHRPTASPSAREARADPASRRGHPNRVAALKGSGGIDLMNAFGIHRTILAGSAGRTIASGRATWTAARVGYPWLDYPECVTN